MQREVRDERDAVAAAARREAAQRTERELWETVQNGLLPARACPAVRGPAAGRPLPPGRARPARRRRLLRRDGAPRRAPRGDGGGHGGARRLRGRPGRGAALRVAHARRREREPGDGARGPERPDGRPRRPRRGPVRLDPLHAHRARAARWLRPRAGTRRRCCSPPSVCQPLEPLVAGPLLGVFDEAEWPVTHAALPPGRHARALHRRPDRGAPRRRHVRHRAGLRGAGRRAPLGARAARRAPHRGGPPPRGPEPARRRGDRGGGAPRAATLGTARRRAGRRAVPAEEAPIGLAAPPIGNPRA